MKDERGKSFLGPHLVLALTLLPTAIQAGGDRDERCPFFAYLTGKPAPRMITYTPSQLDPRNEVNQKRLATSSIRADLEALRPVFDGLILYGYNESSTPRTLAVARDLKFRAVVLGIWEPKSVAEVDGVSELARIHEKDFALAVLIGNEGITFKRYEWEDLNIADARLRRKLPKRIPVSTSEPRASYESEAVRAFGDFLAPNIHPVFDQAHLPAAEAAAWTREQALGLARQAKKPLMIKETGFPHGGMAPYDLETQKAFWTAYLKPGILIRPPESPGSWVFYGVAFEAFDLPWKSEESRLPIEKAWGLFSAERKPYPAVDAWRAAARREEGALRR